MEVIYQEWGRLIYVRGFQLISGIQHADLLICVCVRKGYANERICEGWVKLGECVWGVEIGIRYRTDVFYVVVGHKIVDHSDIVGAHVRTVPSKSSFLTEHLIQWIGQRQLQDLTRNVWVLGFGELYTRGLTVDILMNTSQFTWSNLQLWLETDLSGPTPTHQFIPR